MTDTAASSVPAPAENPRQRAQELGLTDDEYDRIVATLGRAPSTAEIGTYSVMWSEHCSYKSSKIHLRNLPTEGDHILVGPGENAGVVDAGDGLAVAFKIESHNSPSFVEPFQGATTGVGGIIRDILTMGARPIAIMDPLRFGNPGSERTQMIVDGVVRGIGHYGNSTGIATVGGEVDFDPSYDGNPLVNALCAGVLPADRIQLARAERPGDIAVLIGQRTGRDGIGGASVLASADFSDDGVDEAKRPNVQVGDPFAGKLLIESCLELYRRDLLSGIQDMGAAGIACSTAEMASAASMGIRVDLDRVPLREPDMEAWEILCSESQERMLALVSPERLDEVRAVCARWGVDATAIGEVTHGDRLVFTHHGEVVHDAPAASLADEGPVYDRPVRAWEHPSATVDVDAEPFEGDLHHAVTAVLASPHVASPSWITQQYDSIVQSGTVQGPGGDAAVLRLPDAEGVPNAGRRRGVAMATDGNGRWCALDPQEGAKLVVAEAARNVACTGAQPVAATNCLNFGSPERPEIMGQLTATIEGIRQACLALSTPITGGNVSLYNSTGETAIHPTPVIGVLGLHSDVTASVPSTFSQSGDVIVQLGAATRPGLAGSVFEQVVRDRLAGQPPKIDLEAEAALQRLLVSAAEAGLLRSAHDVAAGGLVTSVVEAAIPQGLAAVLEPETELPAHQWLFSESPTRVVASVAPEHAEELAKLAASLGVGCFRVGTVTDSDELVFGDALRIPATEAAHAVSTGFTEALALD